MKKVSLIIAFSGSLVLFGQETMLERQAARTKEKLQQRTENRIEKGVDKTLDKTEEKIEGGVKKGKQSKTKKGKQSGTEQSEQPAQEQPISENASNSTNSGNSENVSNTTGNTSGNKSFASYTKFDFMPGEKVIAFEDFSQDAIGDFPHQWNTNASGEIVTLENQTGKWMQFAPRGIFYPEYIGELPDNFTLEMDLFASPVFSSMLSGLSLFFPEMESRNLMFDNLFSSQPQAGVDIHPHGESGTSSIWVFGKSGEQLMSNQVEINTAWKIGEVNRISIWKQKNRLRVYVNEVKVWDIQKAFLSDLKYSMLLGTNIFEGTIYASNIRVAEGAPDTRNKLLTEGKLISRGILFDVNSDRIKPESYGSVQEIAKVLKESPEVNVKIVGHTDADGEAEANLELSKKRAEAVKQLLITEFKIEASRLQTDGKGEAEPTDPNTTPVGKANNRRVEFIKL